VANKSGASPQAVSLPAGGGDIRGLGETFQPDLNSGTGNYRVPLDLLPGIHNFQPTLGLVYSTGTGNGAWGLGWNFPVPSISRRTFRGVPTYDDERDTFLYGGTTELVEVGPNTYRARLEHGFEQLVRKDAGWQVTEKSGIRHFFGQIPESRIEFDEDGPVRIFAWLIDRTEDSTGNTITYHYRQEGSQRYLQEVRYAIYTIRFEYEARPDPFSEFRSGFELRTTLRCARITIHAEPAGTAAVRSWKLDYDEAPLSRISLLSRVTYAGFDPETGVSLGLPPLEFSYTGFDPSQRRYQRFISDVGAPPPGLDNPNLELIDLDGHGLPGVVAVENGSPRYWSNRGHLRWEAPRALPQFPSVFSLGDDRVRFADMDGNGGADVLVGSGSFSGYYENNGHGQWDRFNHYVRSPSFAFESGDIHLVDIDGDGLIDAVHSGRTGLQVYKNRGPAGWEPPALVPKGDPAASPPDLSFTDPRIRLADMTGDGMLDVVQISSGRLEYWPSRGNGRYAPSRVFLSSPRFPYPFDASRVFLTDLNGDGLTDVVYVAFDEVTYWINQSGNGFSAPRTIRYTPPTSRPDTLRVVDMNGTGTAGLLWTNFLPDYRYLDFTGGVRPGLMERIDNHLGRVTTIEYSTSTEQAVIDRAEGEAWNSFLPFPVQVVSSVTAEDNISGLRHVTRYRYHEGHYDGQRREFDGFARSEQDSVGDASMPSAVNVFHFHTEDSARALVSDPEMRRTLKRKLFRIEVYGRDGSPNENLPYRVEESEWAIRVEETLPDGQKVLFPHVAETSISTFERTASARIERRTFTFDQFGNVLTEVRRGEGDPTAPLFLQTSVEYAYNMADRVLDRVSRIVQRDETGDLLSETRHYYDGPAFQGLPSGQSTKGLLSRTERVALVQADAAGVYGVNAPDFTALGYHAGQDADGRAVLCVDQERRQMDARGNVIAKQDGRGNTTTYTFDAFGLFAIAIADAKGFVGNVEHNYAVARPRSMVNPNGGTTEARYDPLGRIAKVAFPGDTLDFPTAAYTYDTSVLPAARAIEYRVVAGQPATVRIFEYLDGNGTIFQRRTAHDGNTFAVSGHHLTNAQGKTSEKRESFFDEGSNFQPYVDSPTAPRQRFFYDALGRPVATINADDGQSRAVFEPFRSLFYDSGDTDSSAIISFDTPREEQYDAWQRLVAVAEQTPSSTFTTRYLVDPLGRLRQVTDARGITTTRITYDLLGNQIAIQHVDAGLRLIAYDAAGKGSLSVDAAGQTVERTYDELNRIVSTIYRGASAEQYFYDSGSGTNLIGRLARVIDPSGETVFSYDTRGNLLERTKTVPNQPDPFTFRFLYDRLGRVTQLTYPDDVAVDFEYGSGMMLRRIPGYVNDIEYSAAGVRSAMNYANGVRTEYRFDPLSLRLSEIETSQPSSGNVYFHTRYTISKAGNIESIADMRPGAPGFNRNQSFAYDAFYRLTHAEGSSDSGTYTHDYQYDEVDNFVSNPLFSPHPFVYAGGGTSNRLTGINDGGNIINLFEYDANGNTITMPGRILSFDPRQQLERVQTNDGKDVRFFYDYRGILARKELAQMAGTSTTLFFDNLYEVRDGTTVRWVFAGELPVARESGGTRVFLHNDHLGSTVVYTDTGGNRLSETAYYPFGAISLPPGASALPVFTTKQLDVDIGLYYFGARWYAPDIGRFISPDPLYLFQPDRGIQEPRRLNLYAYAGNNPLRFVDPTGLGFWDVLGAVVVVVAVVVAVVAVAMLTFGVGAMIGFGTFALYAGAAGLAGAALGAIVGGAVYGSGEGALRGALIGFTAGVNAFIGGALGAIIFGSYVGAALGVITFLSIIPPIAKSDVYQGILGWTSYLMPMSWPGHAIGLAVFALNVVGYLVTFGQVDYCKITDMKVDWKTGTIATLGGWASHVIPPGTDAGSIGGFAFFNPDKVSTISDDLLDHEAGHMLNNAAFGWFQVYNVFDPRSHDDQYFEQLAESNAPSSRGLPRSDQWG
jgi:RHS repeat-associated protein